MALRFPRADVVQASIEGEYMDVAGTPVPVRVRAATAELALLRLWDAVKDQRMVKALDVELP